MAHTNLFLYESEADFLAEYPDGVMHEPVPGVAYIMGEEGELGTLHTNRDITTYQLTVHSTNKSGVTVAPDKTIESDPVLYGENVKVNVVADQVEGYKPRHEVEKVTISASTEHTMIYLAATSYTVTVNHVCSGESIASSTTIEVEDIYEEDVARVTIEPLNIPGYTAESVTISVSGDMTYNLEYEESGPSYVDLGLPSGTLWATCNIGASSPEEFGDYYAWGEIVPNKASAYTNDNYRFYDSNIRNYTKYNDNDGKTELDPEDDIVTITYGGDWHMPQYNQFDELVTYCSSGYTTLNGVNGVLFTSSINGNTLFFPYAGSIWGEGLESGYLEILGVEGNSGGCVGMGGNDSSVNVNSGWSRYAGYSIRAVRYIEGPDEPDIPIVS